MKTRTKITAILSMLIALLAFMPGTTQAQCNNSMINKLGCPVTVQVDVFDKNPTPPPICNPFPCSSYVTTVPPGGSMLINCTGCISACNIRVTVLNIGGNPAPAGSSADFSTTTFPGNFIMPLPLPCSTTGATYIWYDSGNGTFYFHN